MRIERGGPQCERVETLLSRPPAQMSSSNSNGTTPAAGSQRGARPTDPLPTIRGPLDLEWHSYRPVSQQWKTAFHKHIIGLTPIGRWSVVEKLFLDNVRDLVDWRSEKYGQISVIADLTQFGLQSPPTWGTMIRLVRYMIDHGARDRIHFVSRRPEFARRIATLFGFPGTKFGFHPTMEEAVAAAMAAAV